MFYCYFYMTFANIFFQGLKFCYILSVLFFSYSRIKNEKLFIKNVVNNNNNNEPGESIFNICFFA